MILGRVAGLSTSQRKSNLIVVSMPTAHEVDCSGENIGMFGHFHEKGLVVVPALLIAARQLTPLKSTVPGVFSFVEVNALAPIVVMLLASFTVASLEEY